MAIEPNILPLKSVSRDSSSSPPPPVRIRIIQGDPAEEYSYTFDSSTGEYTAEYNRPTSDNQWGVYANPDAGPYRFELYNSLKIPGNQYPDYTPDSWVWRRVQLSSSVIDSRTGKPWDPNAGFYDPLAS